MRCVWWGAPAALLIAVYLHMCTATTPECPTRADDVDCLSCVAAIAADGAACAWNWALDEADSEPCQPATGVHIKSPAWLHKKAHCYIPEVWHSIQRNLFSLPQEEIDSAITAAASAFPESSTTSARRLAGLLLSHASRWTHRRALSRLTAAIHKAGKRFLADGSSALLSDVLLYLLEKRELQDPNEPDKYLERTTVCFKGVNWQKLPTAEPLALLVDSLFLGLLETTLTNEDNPLTTAAVRSHLKSRLLDDESRLSLLVPIGWVSGLTIFNQPRIRRVAATLAEHFAAFLSARDLTADGAESHIDDFLKDHVVQRLAAALQMDAAAVTRRIVWLDAPAPNPSQLVEHYAQHMPSLSDFVMVMKHWAEPDDNVDSEEEEGNDWTQIFWLLRDKAAVFSFNRLARLAAQLADALVSELGTTAGKWFWIPESGKSFSIANLIFFMNVHSSVDAGQFLPYSQSAKCRADSCHFIIVDDLSSSGDQMMYAALPPPIKKAKRTPALLVATRRALENREGWVHSWMQELPPSDWQPLPYSTSSGYNSQTALFTFPYMSPDNNAALGAKVLAALFTPILGVKFAYGVSTMNLFLQGESDWETAFNNMVAAVDARSSPSPDFRFPLVWI